MLTTIAIVLIVLWALGFFGGIITGGFIHLLLAIALILIILRLAKGQNFTD
jgi:hypothetical protein